MTVIGETINTGPGQRTGDRKTRDLWTGGPGNQGPVDVAVLCLAFITATCLHVLSSNIRLYCCEPHCQRSHAKSLETLTLCMQVWLCKTVIRLH